MTEYFMGKPIVRVDDIGGTQEQREAAHHIAEVLVGNKPAISIPVTIKETVMSDSKKKQDQAKREERKQLSDREQAQRRSPVPGAVTKPGKGSGPVKK